MLIAYLTFPIPYVSIPKPTPDSPNSPSPSAPNLKRLKFFLISETANLSFYLRNLLPPLFFLGLSSGGAKGLFIFGGGASYIFSNLYNINSFNFSPAVPLGHVRIESILAHFDTLFINKIILYKL